MDKSALQDVGIVVPVFNGGSRWREAAAALRRAVPDPAMVTIIDSNSTDQSDEVALGHGFQVERIDPRTFNHGRTRQSAVDRFCRDRRFVIFLTHDAVIEGWRSLGALIDSFSDPSVGAAYGRQLPHRHARPFEAHFVLFNYPPRSDTRSLADAGRLGIKAAYISNSFAAYRTAALKECGGFPGHLILGEDTFVALKMLEAGWRIRYCAEAPVRHSHGYTIGQEMRRYFDFGVLHAQLPQLLERLGRPEGEGARFVVSELCYMLNVAPLLVPQVIVRNAAKYVGYRIGRVFTRLPRRLCQHLSMTKVYWGADAREACRRYETSR